jgi:hypothetical protein
MWTHWNSSLSLSLSLTHTHTHIYTIFSCFEVLIGLENGTCNFVVDCIKICMSLSKYLLRWMSPIFSCFHHSLTLSYRSAALLSFAGYIMHLFCTFHVLMSLILAVTIVIIHRAKIFILYNSINRLFLHIIFCHTMTWCITLSHISLCKLSSWYQWLINKFQVF